LLSGQMPAEIADTDGLLFFRAYENYKKVLRAGLHP